MRGNSDYIKKDDCSYDILHCGHSLYEAVKWFYIFHLSVDGGGGSS